MNQTVTTIWVRFLDMFCSCVRFLQPW